MTAYAAYIMQFYAFLSYIGCKTAHATLNIFAIQLYEVQFWVYAAHVAHAALQFWNFATCDVQFFGCFATYVTYAILQPMQS